MWIIVEKGFQEIKPEFDVGNKKHSFIGENEADVEKTIENQTKSGHIDLKNIHKKRHEISNQAKIIGRIQKKKALFTHGPAELNALISDIELKRVIHENPQHLKLFMQNQI